MVKPTFFQKVLGRPSQRYSAPPTTHDIQHPDAYRGAVEEPKLDLRLLDDDEPFFTPASSPFHSATNSPSTTPPTSAASSANSLSDAVLSSVSLPDNTISGVADRPNRKLTYTDEDWANDVRWLAVPRTDNQKPKSKASRRRSSPPTVQIPASHSTSSLPSRLPTSVPHPHLVPSRPSKSKSISKAKISAARSVVGMTALLEEEEDSDSDGAVSRFHDMPVPQKRALPTSHPPDRSLDAYHRPRVSSPLRSSKLSRQRSFSSPALLPAADKTPDIPVTTPIAAHPVGSSARRSSTSILRPLSPVSTTASTSRSPYTSPAPNVLDALAAHPSVSDSLDALPSTGTRGYTSLVLPHATTTLPSAPSRVWSIGKSRPNGANVRDTIGVGLGFGDQVDLSRARLAQTTMASVEIVRGIAGGSGMDRKSHRSRASLFGVAWFSKDKSSTTPGKNRHVDTDSPLGFTAYRAPPVYVGGGSILVQVWGVGLDGTDARLTGIHPPRVSSSLAGAPYGTKMSKPSEKDKARSPPVGYIPGRSFVGRVLEVGWEVGPDVAKRGDWVVGLMSVHKCGALAEFILADRHRVHRVPNPFTHLKYPLTSVVTTGSPTDAGSDVSRRRDPPPAPADENCLTVNELALLPLCGVPAYRAIRTFHQITERMGKPQLPYGNSHNELHPILPPRTDQHDFNAGGDQEDSATWLRPGDVRPRALVLRAHDGAGALAAQMLIREGWSVWAHVPVPFMLLGAQLELPDELKDEEEEREHENQRNMLRSIEERLREWGVDEVLFVPVASMPLSALFEASNPTLEAMSSLSSIHFPRSPSSSPSISPSPYSRSATSTPVSSPCLNGPSSVHLSSPPTSSTHQNVFTTPYSFAPLPLTPYDCEQGSVVSLLSFLGRSRVRLDAILDTIGGREIWDAGRQLLSRPVRDPSRQDVDALFTTLVGDIPDRVVSTAGDNFRAGVRALRLGGAKDPHPFEDSGYHESVTNGHGKDKKAKTKPRPVNYSWVNVVSDIDWEGSDVHDTLCTLLRMASSDGVKPVIGPPDFANVRRKDKGKQRASAVAEGIEQSLSGKVVPFENTPDVFLPGGGLEYGGTVVSRVAA